MWEHKRHKSSKKSMKSSRITGKKQWDDVKLTRTRARVFLDAFVGCVGVVAGEEGKRR